MDVHHQVPLSKKILFGLAIFLGVFSTGIGLGYMVESLNGSAKNSSQSATAANAERDDITSPNPYINPNSTAAENPVPIASINQLSATNKKLPGLTLTFTGGISMNGTMKRLVKEKLDGNYDKIFGAAEALISKADISYGNFNGTFSLTDKDRTEFGALTGLRDGGFDIISTTHTGNSRDKSRLIETMLSIDGHGLSRTGSGWSYESAREPKLIEKDGQTVGYLAFSDNKSDWIKATGSDAGILSANDPQIEEIIAEAKAKSDILVVAFTWDSTSKEHTLRQELLARTAIDSGASIVVGHYGSSLHDIEYYHGGLIAYNLGTFIKGSGQKNQTINGLILETNIQNGVISNIRTYGVTEHQNGYIDSVNEISVESLIREKGVINTPQELFEKLPESVSKQATTRGPNVRKVAITIDDAWNPATFKRALDILSLKNAKATIFPVSANADANKFNIIRTVNSGHELGNHTDTHGWLTQMTETDIAREMDIWQKKIDSALGQHYETNWFRPPFMAGFAGHTKTAESVTKLARQRGMRIALWTVDPFFGIGQKADSQAIANFIVSQSQPGGIILLHFTREHVEALPAIIDGLRAKGLEPVTLSELVGSD